MTKVPARPRRAKPAPPPEEQPAPLARIPINGGDIQAAAEGGRVWIPIRRVCDVLRVSTERQVRKLERKGWATTALKAVVAEDGKKREVLCIDLEALPMWLATIEPSRVHPEIRPKLELYQKTAARVLRDHFFGRPPEASAPPIEPQAAPVAPPKLPPAPPSLPLRRIRAAERVLDFVEQDLAMLERLSTPLAQQELPPRWATEPPILLQLRAGISHGLAWVYDAIKATLGAQGPAEERWKALVGRWKALMACHMRFV